MLKLVQHIGLAFLMLSSIPLKKCSEEWPYYKLFQLYAMANLPLVARGRILVEEPRTKERGEKERKIHN